MAEWPVLDDSLLSVIVHYFKTPLRLQAAFDDDTSCSELISSIFPDLVSEDVANCAAVLMLWKDDNQVGFKRQRRGIVSDKVTLVAFGPQLVAFSSARRCSTAVNC